MTIWPLRKIDDVVHFLNARRVPVKASDREKRSGIYPYYGASGIVDFVDAFIFDGNYLLVSEDGDNLRSRNTPIAFMAKGRFWVNNHAHILDEKEPGILEYLSRALNHTDLSPYVTGAAQPKLNKRTLSKIVVGIPPKDERLRINGMLGALDDKIELNRKTAATLEAMARAIYRSWFVDFDPVRAKSEGRAPSHMDAATAALFPDSFGEDGLPEGWGRGSLLDVVELISGGTPKTDRPDFWDGGIKWASAKDVSQCGKLFLIETERSITGLGLKKSSTKVVPALSTVIVARGATTGRACMFGSDIAMNQTCYALKSKQAAPFYANCLVMDEILEITLAAHGSVFDTITTKTLNAAIVNIPPPTVVHGFESYVRPAFERVLSITKENQTLATLRDTLLPRLMSGELRVGAAKELIEEVA